MLRVTFDARRDFEILIAIEFFFTNTIFLAKTCCTNTTILYNYEQVELNSDLCFTF
jgi:hypothetical protein